VCFPCNNCPHTLLNSVTLKDEWTTIELLFTQPPIIPTGATNNSPLLCETIFDGSLTNLLGTGYSCEITGNKLIVNLGQNAQFRPESKLNVKLETFFVTSCDCPWKNQISISSTEPAPVTLTATPNPTSPLGICGSSTITLSGLTGIGKRPLYTSYSYTVDSVKTSDSRFDRPEIFVQSRSELMAFLSNKKDTTVTIPGSLLLESTIYTIKIIFTTFIGEYIGYVNIETAYPSTPRIALNGEFDKSIYTMTENQKFSVTPGIHNGACFLQSLSRFNFTWSQVIRPTTNKMNETMLNNSYSVSNGYLEIQPFTLVPESTYELFLNASHKDFPIYTNTSIIINVLGNKLLAVITGGDRSIGVQEELILDASSSEDSIFFLLLNYNSLTIF